jgi:uncharacterized protein
MTATASTEARGIDRAMSTLRQALWRAGLPARWAALMAIRGYRASLGKIVGGRCRFHPTCSAYAEQAVSEWGVLRGGALAIWRVLRCSPLTAGGIDHPPHRRVGSVIPGASGRGAA